MGLTMDKASVSSGLVEFEITNTSKNTMHEFLVAPWKGSLTSLSYDKSESQVVEGKVPGLQGQGGHEAWHADKVAPRAQTGFLHRLLQPAGPLQDGHVCSPQCKLMFA